MGTYSPGAVSEPGTITVARALELPALRRGLPEILTAPGELQRPVRWVHAGETPRIACLLRGGELLLTTGIGLGSRAAEQRAYIRTLAERGIAALVVELGSRFTALPAAVVDTARSLGLPLVQLHREVPFVAVTEEIHTELVNAHYGLLRQADEVHRQCAEVRLRGGGVPEILRLFARFADNPVFLETPDGRLLYAAGPTGRAGLADPLQIWDGLRARRPGTATAAGDPTHAQETPQPPAGSVLVDVPGGGPGPGAVRARLVALPVAGPLAPVHRIAAERTATLLALVLLQARQEEELAARGRGDFLTDLAEERIAAADAPAQARVLGFRPGDGPLLPVVMALPTATASLGGGNHWAALASALREELAAVGVPALLGVRLPEARVPLLVGLRGADERISVAERVAGALRAGVERAWPERAPALGQRAERARGRRWSWWDWWAAGTRPAPSCGTRRRRRARRAGCRTGRGTTCAASRWTCCCGGCASTATSRPSSTA